ncbi:unnamed protein product [Clavelina lepadiformis]|uniref:Carboxylesterase type B domain-containing protein n=2 Tax=Clavelina lepadiformis TaxID=159417 RepID=A0ABP0GGJ9_CLALP
MNYLLHNVHVLNPAILLIGTCQMSSVYVSKMKSKIYLRFVFALLALLLAIAICVECKNSRQKDENSEARRAVNSKGRLSSTRGHQRKHHKKRLKLSTYLRDEGLQRDVALSSSSFEGSGAGTSTSSISHVNNNVPHINFTKPINTKSANKTIKWNTSDSIALRYHTLTINQGKIRGRVEKVLNKDVGIFLGIQFGDPPIGEKRFLHPTPSQSWNDTKDALHYPPTCFQWEDFSFDSYEKGFRGTRMWNPNTKLDEDCLYLNVWAPIPMGEEKLAVMVWIYGGGYYSGTSSLDVYDGKWLAATQNVIVVSMNYRIGALGFLATGSKDFPGNAGLFDQRLALQWVQNNIHVFGGDPAKVTLFGESAGAASVALHATSKRSKGLFRNIILQSASSLSPWTLLSKKEAKRRAVKLASLFGCLDGQVGITTNKEKAFELCQDDGELYKISINATCMREVDAKKLVNDEMMLEDWGIAGFPNAPVLDGDFVESHPHNLGTSLFVDENINILAGFNANEGNYFLIYSGPGYDFSTESKINKSDFAAGVDKSLRSIDNYDCGQNAARNLLSTATDFKYTDGFKPFVTARMQSQKSNEKKSKNQSNDSIVDRGLSGEIFYRNRIDDLVGDLNFVCPTVGFLDKILKQGAAQNKNYKGNMFLYNFVQRSSQNPWPEWMGVMHGYEIEFVFGLPLDNKLGYKNSEKQLSLAMMERWGNFAKFGDPNGNFPDPDASWLPYNSLTKSIYLMGDDDVANSAFSMFSPQYMEQESRCAFWNEYVPNMKKEIDQLLVSPFTCNVMQPPGGKAPAMRAPNAFVYFLVISIVALF